MSFESNEDFSHDDRCLLYVFSIPEGTEEVTQRMIRGRTDYKELDGVNIPNSVVKIDDGAFSECHRLSSIVIPNSVTWTESMFCGCTSLTEAPNIPDGVTNADSMFKNCTSLMKAPVIPDSVTSKEDVFYGCTSLEISDDKPIPNVKRGNEQEVFETRVPMPPNDAPEIPNGATHTDCSSELR